MTYSFDVFDTCLCRLCGEPRNMYDVLSTRVQQLMGEDGSEHMRQLFVVARAQAGGKNLREIYSCVAQVYPLPCSVDDMVDLELDTERLMLKPILATLELVKNLRKKGDILFISDMYLSSGFIREQLVKYGFYQAGDCLYVSDEVGAWKRDGSLYRLIHEKKDLVYRQWHHYGDNWHSDCSVPRSFGIHAHHLHYDYLPYEEKWSQNATLQYQYPSILAGVARAVRLSSDAPDNQKAFVCDVTAPLMVSWVLQVLYDAEQRGIRRLYFCARDMHSHYHIALIMQPLFPNIAIRYLFISSPALYNSQRCIDYLRQEGFCDNVLSAIVDSCSSGKTIRVMNGLLAENGYNPIYGYFWGKMSVGGEPFVDEYFELDADYLSIMTNGRIKRIIGMRVVFEILMSINYHKKTVGYEERYGRIRPVFEEDQVDSFFFANGKTLRENKKYNDALIMSFADGMIKTGLHHFYQYLFNRVLVPQLIDFSNYPYAKYLDYLHEFQLWGKPFVGRLTGNGQGIWKRGNLFYRLPYCLTSFLRAILSDDKKRRQLNQILIWKNRS